MELCALKSYGVKCETKSIILHPMVIIKYSKNMEDFPGKLWKRRIWKYLNGHKIYVLLNNVSKENIPRQKLRKLIGDSF